MCVYMGCVVIKRKERERATSMQEKGSKTVEERDEMTTEARKIG